MRRKARDRKLRKRRSFDCKEGAVWLAFKAHGFVMEVNKGRKGVGEERNRKNISHVETFLTALGLGYFQYLGVLPRRHFGALCSEFFGA